AKAGIKENLVQENHSRSKKNVLRGLHFQKSPKAQGKLVQCLHGKIFDVAVDIRKKSPTFLKWVGVELSQDNGEMLYVPKGFAHGFLVLSNSADVIYKCTAEYSPKHERGIIWNDPQINIVWPSLMPLLSDKDEELPLSKDAKL
ncbi:MAG: dTDP-4-dehydrorhamnose 3,5-epimerase, partial [Elusimicrobia bacterium]|nr:dTDP-4-dehydrorhamnose 3,5-epimerase [Elusimicrobiota bacterium]